MNKAKKDYPRKARVADLLHRTLGQILQHKFHDPRVGMVTISEVEVSQDLREARVFFSILESDKIEETSKILNKAKGFFRTEVAASVQLRCVPNISFYYDGSIATGARISSLLSNAKK